MLPQVFRAFLLLIACLSIIPAASGQSGSDDPAIEARMEALLQQMTLEEKLGQMSQYSGGMPTRPGTGRTSYEEMIAKGQVSSLLNVSGQEANRYQKIAVEQSRLKIPLIFGLDVIHGYRTIFPIPLALSATWDPALVEKSAAIAAVEARADGIRWTFSPMVDIARDARWGRIAEGAGEDPYLGSAMAQAYIRGYQGKSPSEKTSILACMKHYVGYGAAEGGRDYNTTEIPERLLRQVYLPPFKAGLDAGASTVMSAFNALNGVPASANPFTLDQILRREWQFKGFVVSDWTAIAETIAHGTAIDSADAARKSVLAGVDMDMESDLYRTALAGRVKAGKVPESTIDDAVRRILRVKFVMGLFDEPYAPLKPEKKLLPAHRQAAREAAEKSFVLLRNEGLLPLKPGARIALIGPLAGSAQDMLGSWGAKGEAGDVVTLRTALATKIGTGLGYAKGTDILGNSESGFAEAIEAARHADIAILALGENAQDMTGEAASRSELGLPGNQQKLLEAVAEDHHRAVGGTDRRRRARPRTRRAGGAGRTLGHTVDEGTPVGGARRAARAAGHRGRAGVRTILDGFGWLTTADNWWGRNGLLVAIRQHLWYSFLALAGACVIGLPIGLVIGHTGRGRFVASNMAGLWRAIPTVGVVALLFGWRPLTLWPVLVALLILAVPPIVLNAAAGIEGVPADVRDAARGMGLTGVQTLWQVEVPNALPLIIAGIRSAANQVIASATIAGFVGLGALGVFIFSGTHTREFDKVTGASIAVVTLVLVVELAFALLQRHVISAGVRRLAGYGEAPCREIARTEEGSRSP